MKKTFAAAVALAIGLGAGQSAVQAQPQGMSKSEIVLGALQDLSGPIAILRNQARQGMMLRLDEANEQGGIHGHRLRLLVEDVAYNPKKAVMAAQKLHNQDRIFATVGTLGTPINMATMPLLFEKNVTSFLPLSSSSEMSQPFHRLKYASFAPYFDTFSNSLPKFVKEKSASRVCILYQDDDFGFDILRGTEAGPGLNTDARVKSMDSLTVPSDLFGRPELTFSPTKHLGRTQSRLSQIQNGRWKVISDYMKTP